MGKPKYTKLKWFTIGLWLSLWAFYPAPPWYIHALPVVWWILMMVDSEDNIIW